MAHGTSQALAGFSVRTPVVRTISERSYRHIFQSVCPWNVKFAQELTAGSPFAARQFIAGKDSLTFARDILALDPESFGAAFKKSPMKRAKLAGLQRNAAVVLGYVGMADGIGALTHALESEEPLVREHAACALRKFDSWVP